MFEGGGSRARKRQRKLRGSTIAVVKQRAASCGSHFFERGTLRFFNSKVERSIYPSRDGRRIYFITSEQFKPSSGIADKRRWSLRVQRGCRIATVGDFQAYSSLTAARDAARALVRRR